NAAATVQVSVTVAAGTTTKTFPVNTSAAVTVPTAVTITATYSGVVKTATLTVNPAAAALLLESSVKRKGMTGNAGSNGTVKTTRAAADGCAVVTPRSSNGAAATVQGTVTVAAGTTTKTFPVNTIGGTVPTAVTITATYSGVVKTATLTVNPAAAAL